MRIKLGALLTEASGKLGGCVIQKGNSSLVMRTLLAKRKIQSSWLQQSKSESAYVASQWRLLSAANRKFWNSETRYDSSGFSLFVKLNSNLIQAGLPIILKPFPARHTNSVLITNISYIVNLHKIEFDFDGDIPANVLIIPEASRQLSRAFGAKSPRFCSFFPRIPDDEYIYLDSDKYVARFGSFHNLGCTVAFRLKFVDILTGQSVFSNVFLKRNI